MSYQCYKNKVGEMPTAELKERIELLYQRFGGGDSKDANAFADETVAMKIAALEAELHAREEIL